MSKILDKFFTVTLKYHERYKYKKYFKKTTDQIRSKFAKVTDKKILSDQQKSEITKYYENLTGKKVSLLYHEYFYSRTGVYSKEYMPIDLYEADLIGRANRWDYYDAYSDKNMDEVYLPHIRHPKTFLKNINGYFYRSGLPIGRNEAIEVCSSINEAIIKPSLLSRGKGVKQFSALNGVTNIDGKTVAEIFDDYKKDFIIQESVRQHPQIAALNPSSVNTIRIMTYRSGMEVIVVYAVIRIGRKGQIIDNQSAGGISTVIHEDGRLGKYAFGVAGNDKIEITDTGIVLENYPIPFFEKAIETVKRSHYDLPFFDIVGWDVSIDETGEPVLIEWNGNPGPSQTACGTGLGEYTERIIKEIWDRPNTRSMIFGGFH